MKRKKLLIIDDQAGIRFLLSELFSERNFMVFEANSLENAMAVTKEELPDIALIDLRLGSCDGGDVVQALKSIHDGLIPIIMTGQLEEKKLGKAIEHGAVYCLEKPFDLNEVVNLVNTMYDKYENT